MKKNVIIVMLMLGTISITATGCSSNNQEELTEKDTTKVVEEVIKELPIETKEVVFKKGKLIEVAFRKHYGVPTAELNDTNLPFTAAARYKVLNEMLDKD
ncbi:MAG: hypothetical protein JKY30_11995, partial [Flavobacteriales bacterium]|nr:hypothetical protein [Flavobacteriales bacterium]